MYTNFNGELKCMIHYNRQNYVVVSWNHNIVVEQCSPVQHCTLLYVSAQHFTVTSNKYFIFYTLDTVHVNVKNCIPSCSSLLTNFLATLWWMWYILYSIIKGVPSHYCSLQLGTVARGRYESAAVTNFDTHIVVSTVLIQLHFRHHISMLGQIISLFLCHYTVWYQYGRNYCVWFSKIFLMYSPVQYGDIIQYCVLLGEIYSIWYRALSMILW